MDDVGLSSNIILKNGTNLLLGVQLIHLTHSNVCTYSWMLLLCKCGNIESKK